MADRGLCTREEIPAEAKWAIEDLYKNDDEWEADFTRLKEHLPELSAYEGRLGLRVRRPSFPCKDYVTK